MRSEIASYLGDKTKKQEEKMDRKLEEELKALHAQIEELNSFHKCLTKLQVRIAEFITYVDDRIRALEEKLE